MRRKAADKGLDNRLSAVDRLGERRGVLHHSFGRIDEPFQRRDDGVGGLSDLVERVVVGRTKYIRDATE